MQPIKFRSEQSINGVKIKRLACGGGGKNNPQRLVPYNDGFVLYIAAQCNFVYLHMLRESAILVSGRFILCRTPRRRIVVCPCAKPDPATAAFWQG